MNEMEQGIKLEEDKEKEKEEEEEEIKEEDQVDGMIEEEEETVSLRTWQFCGWKMSKECVTYLTRTLFLYMIVAACVVNVSMGIKPVELWITLLVVSMSGMGINMAGTVIAKDRQLQSSFPMNRSN